MQMKPEVIACRTLKMKGKKVGVRFYNHNGQIFAHVFIVWEDESQ